MCSDYVVKSATMTISEAYQRPKTSSESQINSLKTKTLRPTPVLETFL